MLHSVDINKTVEFSSKDDKDKPKTVFVLKPLTGSQMLDSMRFFDGKKFDFSGEYVFSLLDSAIVEIKNPDIKDAKKIHDFLEGLPQGVLLEVMVKIRDSNIVSENESKN